MHGYNALYNHKLKNKQIKLGYTLWMYENGRWPFALFDFV